MLLCQKRQNKPEGFDKAMNYMNGTIVDEDDFLWFRISECFSKMLRDTFKLYQENGV